MNFQGISLNIQGFIHNSFDFSQNSLIIHDSKIIDFDANLLSNMWRTQISIFNGFHWIFRELFTILFISSTAPPTFLAESKIKPGEGLNVPQKFWKKIRIIFVLKVHYSQKARFIWEKNVILRHPNVRGYGLLNLKSVY